MNILAIIVAAIINMVIGAVWYRVFSKPWSALTGVTMEEGQSGAGPGYALVSVGSIVIAIVLSYLISELGITSFIGGIGLGLLAWLGFVAPTHAANFVFESRPWKLFAINTGYFLVSLMVMGGVLGAWQ